MIAKTMSITTERIPNLPAVLATHKGHITRGDVEQMYVDTSRLLAAVDAPYYRINDVREMQTDFREFMGILLSLSDSGPFRTTDPQLKVVFVGTNQWVLNIRSVMARKGLPPKLCTSMEEALAYVDADWTAARGRSST